MKGLRLDKQNIVSWGREEAASANVLFHRQEEAVQKVRERYSTRLQQSRGAKKAAVWLEMQVEMRQARKRLEKELAPQDGVYLRT